ncbi:unnamed protein product [Protopolystoma xenopodis]|uniref:Uncharacterized protein n=1 Tax=Protopolystoma xenopodis TaxID=117903 RepID=A0A448XR39_9PLAT|nr:unnamed protein product [Protopolystoma xenopodis]
MLNRMNCWLSAISSQVIFTFMPISMVLALSSLRQGHYNLLISDLCLYKVSYFCKFALLFLKSEDYYHSQIFYR